MLSQALPVSPMRIKNLRMSRGMVWLRVVFLETTVDLLPFTFAFTHAELWALDIGSKIVVSKGHSIKLPC